MVISYIGTGYEKCDMCHSQTKEKYLALPHLPSLVDWSEMIICKKCARREVGSKNKKKWDTLHDGNNRR